MGKLLFPSSSLIYFFIFLCVTKLVTSQSSLVTNFCNNPVIDDPNFCLKVIGSDPRSKTTKNAHDLEALAIDLGLKFVTTVDNKCVSLSKSEKNPNIKAALGSCAGSYDMVILDFKSIGAAFRAGRSIGPAGSDARLAVSKCDNAFNDKKLTSPLAQENDDLLKFIQIVLANSI